MGWMILLGAIVVIIVLIAIVIAKAQFKRPTTGLDGMIGEVGVVVSRLSPDGRVRIHGREIWNAISLFPGEVIEAGEKVEVVRIEKTTLLVKRKEV
ncbi:hypothetical protein J7M02_06940 [Candidatus Aerophobetes bacterium]|nr:hypothetical protein [Candidatus Aerophobetes bacterium]